jgi:hypothetical protein
MKRSLFIAWGALLLFCRGVAPAADAQPSMSEYQVKALFLLNFARYVEWPAPAGSATNSPFSIGVYGQDKFGQDLRNAIAEKTVGGRTIVIRQIDNADDAGKCSILFISDSEQKHLLEILAQVKDRPVLTVGESKDFLQQGGAINFTSKQGKIRLEINLDAARQAHLQISSRLLKVADTVKGKST